MDKVVKIFLILSVIGGFIGIIIYLRQPSRWAGFQKERSFISSKTFALLRDLSLSNLFV